MKPRAIRLPSGRRVELSARAVAESDGSPATHHFQRAIDAIVLSEDGKPLDVGTIALGDFHVLRAILTRHGALEEDEIDIECRNCGEKITVMPCQGLEVAPWEDDELGDEELDTTLPFGEPIEITTVPLGRVRTASTVTFAARTLAETKPLFAALAKDGFEIGEGVVRAMGITALGTETDPAKIAEALAACDDDAFGSVTDAWLASHYVLRLGCIAICDGCGARNDVDAPYAREFEPVGPRPVAEADDEAQAASEFPDFDAFAARAKEIGDPLLEATPGGAEIELVVDDGTPAVDDGGEPLMGSYVPPHKGDIGMPTRPPTVTVYYRTFRAMWEEDGPYDWDDELHETIEHELEHHVYFLRGDDPMDDDERAVIRDEAARIVGKKETERRAIAGFGKSLSDFAKRTWPIWIIALLALLAMLATQRE